MKVFYQTRAQRLSRTDYARKTIRNLSRADVDRLLKERKRVDEELYAYRFGFKLGPKTAHIYYLNLCPGNKFLRITPTIQHFHKEGTFLRFEFVK